MTLQDFVTTLRKRWVYIVIPFLLLSVAAGVTSKLQTPMYTARASAFFALPFGQSANDLFQGSNYTQQQLGSFAALATEPIVLEPVISELRLDRTATELSRDVSAQTQADSAIVRVSASSSDPDEAATIANALVKQLGRAVQRLSPSTQGNKPSVVVTTEARAEPPTVQSSPNTARNILAAALAGLILGLLAALARERLDTRVRGQDDLPEGVSVLGSVPFERQFKGRAAGRRGQVQESSTRQEAFRKIRTNLRFLDVDNPVKLITVTSSFAGEGKTSTCLALAKALAEDGHRVLLVDADLRRPRVADYFSIEGAVGLVDVLAGAVPLGLGVQHLQTSGLHVLPSGTIPPNPSELLGSRAMSDLMERLRAEYDLVLFDAPPILPVADALITGAKSDGVVMVTRHGKATRHQVRESIDALHGVEARLLGVVFNMVPLSARWRARSRYSYYDSRPDRGFDERSAQLQALADGESLVPGRGVS